MRRIRGRQGRASPSRHPRGHQRSGGDSWGSDSGAAVGSPASRPAGAPAVSRWCSPAPARFPRRTPAAAPPCSTTWAAAARPASAAAPPAAARRREIPPRRNAPPSAVTGNPSSLYALLVRCGKRQYSRPHGQGVSQRKEDCAFCAAGNNKRQRKISQSAFCWKQFITSERTWQSKGSPEMQS